MSSWREPYIVPPLTRWLQYNHLHNCIKLHGVRLTQQQWVAITQVPTIDSGVIRQFKSGGKVVPCAGKWYANVQLRKNVNEPLLWFQVEIGADFSIYLLAAEEDAKSEQALLHLPLSQRGQYEIRGPVAIWGPYEGRCIMKRLYTVEDRLLAVAMGLHPRLGQYCKISIDMLEFIRPHLVEKCGRPRCY